MVGRGQALPVNLLTGISDFPTLFVSYFSIGDIEKYRCRRYAAVTLIKIRANEWMVLENRGFATYCRVYCFDNNIISTQKEYNYSPL